MTEWMDELERLAELRDKGLITDEEFEVKRQEIVNASSTEVKEESETNRAKNPDDNAHDYGDHDYDVLFPDGRYRDDYNLPELKAMSLEDLEELRDQLIDLGHVETVAEPRSIFQHLWREKREEEGKKGDTNPRFVPVTEQKPKKFFDRYLGTPISYPDGTRANRDTVFHQHLICPHCQQSGYMYQEGREKNRQDLTREGTILGFATWQKEFLAVCWKCGLSSTIKGGSQHGI